MVDFYRQVPKGYRENLDYRVKLRKKAAKDAGLRAAISAACANDILYFFNAFCWLAEPRIRYDRDGKRMPHVIPFLTRSHQDEYFRLIEKNLGVTNIGVKKCRDEGFSWGGVLFATRDLLFKKDIKVGLVSSTEKKSDDPGNMDSLLAKVDWEMERLPKWMTGRKGDGAGTGDWYRNKTNHALVHERNRTSINAFAASPDTGRGGRYLWFLLDEFASRDWQESAKDKAVLEALFEATDSKLIISTPEGTFGEFHRMMTSPSPMVRIDMNWRDNPVKSRGLYRLVKGVPVAVDSVKDPLPAEYTPPTQEVIDRWERLRKKGFNLEEDTRSKWYDEKCDDPEASVEGVSKNVDAKWGGNVSYIFDDGFFAVTGKTTEVPRIKGILTVSDDHQWTFGRSATGAFHLWCPLDAQERPPRHRYVVCADFGHGRGGSYTSNSALHIIDLVTREQVGEFASNTIQPKEFTDVCIAVCEWFWGAHFAWEHNQPGNVCTDRVLERGYGDYYRRKSHDKISQKVTMNPGWWTDDKTKEIMFSDLLIGVKLSDFIIRSAALAEECGQYIRDKGKIKHSSEGPGHGDRVMAFAVGVQAAKDRPTTRVTEGVYLHDGIPPVGTMAYRDYLYQQSQESNDDWDDRSTASFRQGQAANY